ncbi:hypothetical protein Tco_1556503 [Tanacetum coccineum]
MAISGNNFNRGNNGNQARGRAFALGSFNVIVCMDWLSKLREEIVCQERIIRIPLPNNNILEVYGERSEENLKHFTSMKTGEKKLKDIHIISDFPKVFLDDITRLPPIQPVKFRIELVPEATPVAKALYHLAPFKMQELSLLNQELSN